MLFPTTQIVTFVPFLLMTLNFAFSLETNVKIWLKSRRFEREQIDIHKIYIAATGNESTRFLTPLYQGKYLDESGTPMRLAFPVDNADTSLWRDHFGSSPKQLPDSHIDTLFPFRVWNVSGRNDDFQRCSDRLDDHCVIQFSNSSLTDIARIIGSLGISDAKDKGLMLSRDRLLEMESEAPGHLFLCFMEFYRIFNAKGNAQLKRYEKDMEFMSKLYVILLCELFQERMDHDSFLPDPCKNPNLRIPPNAIPDTCQREGCFADMVRFQCRVGFWWNSDVRGCTEKKKVRNCDARSMRNCGIPERASKCTRNIQFSFPVCKCNEGWRGRFCDIQSNGCNTKFMKVPSGNNACRVNLNNTCIAIKDKRFKCLCRAPYQRDISVSHDNCYHSDPCTSMKCQNGGRCQQWLQSNMYYCKCPAEYYGTFCETAFSNWGPWGPWEMCSPNCGPSAHRLRWRSCSGSTACFLGSEAALDRQRCHLRNCSDTDGNTARRKKRVQASVRGRLFTVGIKILAVELVAVVSLTLMRLYYRWLSISNFPRKPSKPMKL